MRFPLGYGMTESCGMCTLLPPELMQCGVAGLPVPSVEIKLLDVPTAGYFSTNNPPRGEVCIRGPSVTKGYFKRPDLNTDEAIFTKDGWLRTGDVGQWNEDGTLSLIDRYVPAQALFVKSLIVGLIKNKKPREAAKW
jgi:long-chain acyl-CoA synthetase